MTQRAPLHPALHAKAFHVREAESHGVPASRLKSKDLHAPYHGVRVARDRQPEQSTLVERCHAYAPLLGPDEFFSHGSAAALWGMWVPGRLERASVIDVTAELTARAPRMKGVRGHHVGVDSVETMLVGNLPVSSPLDTWRQLSALLTVDELVAAGDSLVRRQGALVEEQQLVVALARHARRRGVRKLRAAFVKVRPRVDSPRETTLRLILVSGGLPEPLVNLVVSGEGESPVRFGDLVYERWRVIVEYDGEHHRKDSRQYESDIVRLEALARAGWLVVRVIGNQLHDPATVVARVARALGSRVWRSPACPRDATFG